MRDIDVTEYDPEALARLTPAERDRRALVAARIRSTDFTKNAVFGNVLRRVFKSRPKVAESERSTLR